MDIENGTWVQLKSNTSKVYRVCCSSTSDANVNYTIDSEHNNNNTVSPLYNKNNSNEKDINGHCGYFSHD